MDDYIKRQEILDDVRNTMFTMSMCLTKDELHGMRLAQQIIAKKIETYPAADVAPVRHGRWIEQPLDYDLCGVVYYQCSECGKEQQTPSNYCQFCGARMDMVTDCNQVKDGDGE